MDFYINPGLNQFDSALKSFSDIYLVTRAEMETEFDFIFKAWVNYNAFALQRSTQDPSAYLDNRHFASLIKVYIKKNDERVSTFKRIRSFTCEAYSKTYSY